MGVPSLRELAKSSYGLMHPNMPDTRIWTLARTPLEVLTLDLDGYIIILSGSPCITLSIGDDYRACWLTLTATELTLPEGETCNTFKASRMAANMRVLADALVIFNYEIDYREPVPGLFLTQETTWRGVGYRLSMMGRWRELSD